MWVSSLPTASRRIPARHSSLTTESQNHRINSRQQNDVAHPGHDTKLAGLQTCLVALCASLGVGSCEVYKGVMEKTEVVSEVDWCRHLKLLW